MVYSGNFIAPGDPYEGVQQSVRLGNGKRRVTALGVGILTDTLQTQIPVKIYPARNKELSPDFPLLDIVIPVGAQIIKASFRLPSSRITGWQYEWGKQLPPGCTIVGTSTDVLKIAFARNGFSAANTASLASSSSAYTIGGTGLLTRNRGVADNASGILNTVSGSPVTASLWIDNAANNAAGTGIRLSTTGATAAIAVEVVWEVNEDAVSFDDVMLGGTTKAFYVRS